MRIILLAVCMLMLLLNSEIQADNRFALVIGNYSYDPLTALVNPGNDAKDMAAQLHKIGFTVDLQTDLNYKEFGNVITSFENEAKNADLVIVYYAGHGAQRGAINYLIPIDLDPTAQNFSLAANAIDAEQLQTDLKNLHVKTSIIILDACRDDPPVLQGRAVALKQGLTYMDVLDENLTAYAAAFNHTASDGTDGHGLYTGALLKNIATPNIDINEVFHRTHYEVANISGGSQLPGEYDQLGHAIVLNSTPATSAPAASAQVAALIMSPPRSVALATTTTASTSIQDSFNSDATHSKDTLVSQQAISSKPVINNAFVLNESDSPSDLTLFPHVLIYAPSGEEKNYAETIRKDLIGDDFSVFPIPPTILSKKPDTTEIRYYYYPDDRKEALKIQSIIQSRYPKLHTRISYVIDPSIASPRYYEIHFGKDATFGN